MRFTGKGDWNLDPWLMDVLLRNSMAILYLLKEKKKKKIPWQLWDFIREFEQVHEKKQLVKV
jgi:hypothetical protein